MFTIFRENNEIFHKIEQNIYEMEKVERFSFFLFHKQFETSLFEWFE